MRYLAESCRVKRLLTATRNVVGVHVQYLANAASEASGDGRFESAKGRALIANRGDVQQRFDHCAGIRH